MQYADPSSDRPGCRKPLAVVARAVEGLVWMHWGLLAVPFLYSFMSCGLGAQQGDCGPYLSSAECNNVRAQLGKLDPRPPADASNRFGQCLVPSSQQCVLEDLAADLGKRLFFD